MTQKESWGSRLGFVLAVAGSAIGLANIWRFPYMVGKYGGGAFVAFYVLCLILIGFPVFLSEILIGRTAQESPGKAFEKLGRKKAWGWAGDFTILTGFIVSAFYSTIAGWILGYLVEAALGNIHQFSSITEPAVYYDSLIKHPVWSIGFHAFFLALSLGVLLLGVRNGIERFNKILMPSLIIMLVALVCYGLTLPGSVDGIAYLLRPNWSSLTPTAMLAALGHSFFTLSLGQGTMVTYGSYLPRKDPLLKSCVPVVIMDTLVALLATFAIFTIVFGVGMEPDSGPGLIFHTLPWVFSQIPGGQYVAIIFFLLVLLAALTSEISALEPTIAYLVEEKGFTRKSAVAIGGTAAFIVGIPCALAYNIFSDVTFNGMNILDGFDFVATGLMIPIGGFLAVVLVGWAWGAKNALAELELGTSRLFHRFPFLKAYFSLCFKYTAPILMVLVFLQALGIFS